MANRFAFQSIPIGLGVALFGCVMDNPAFDDRIAAESETRGDPTEDGAGDGDGDPDPSGDGDGDTNPGDGDGDGDGDTGDGDGDPETGDGDGDGDGDPLPLCGAPIEYADCDGVAPNNAIAALGLGCSNAADQSIAISGPVMAAQDPDSWRVAKYFGTAPGPNYGGKLWAARDTQDVPSANPDLPPTPPNTSSTILILSTGTLPPVQADGGVVVVASEDLLQINENPDLGGFPEPITAWHGSNFGDGGTPFMNCDGANDCSDSLHEQWYDFEWNILNDKLWLRFSMVAPPGVHGYMFDFAFFSSEHPTFIDTMYNDMFVAWSSSDDYTGNLTFIGETPMNTTSLDAAGGFSHIGEDPALAGTGFETHAATGWLLARGPAVPGETVQVTLFVSDLGDSIFNSVVLLDNFRWDCAGCAGTDCGFNP